jgi:phage shock protein A
MHPRLEHQFAAKGESQMGILERISTLIKANINELLDKAEDPEKMLNQLIRDMEEGYREAREQVINSMADQKRLEKKYLANLNLAKEWEHKAEVAVQSSDEDLARKALKRAQDYEELSNDLKLALDKQEDSVANLRVQLVALRAKIEEAKQKRGVLVARHRRLEAEEKIRESASGLKATDEAFAAFQRMEDRIELEEMRMEAVAELAELDEEAEAVEARLAQEEAELQIEERLSALKARLAAKGNAE